MIRRTAGLLIGVCILLAPGTARAVNHVYVESMDLALGATGVTVGIYTVNDCDVAALVLPLELRSITTGTYVTGSCTFKVQSGYRIGSSPLAGSVTKASYPNPGGTACSGPTSHTYLTQGAVDFVSPDGVMWAGVSTAAPPALWYLPPGSDSVAGTFTDWPSEGESTSYAAGRSFVLQFDVTSVDGYFEIDTCCVRPANHLSYIDVDVNTVAPGFTRGLIKVGNPMFPPVVSDIPDQTVNEGATFATISLDDYVSDPDNTDNQITWTASGQVALTVSINSSRVATITIPNVNWFGAETVTFTARDPDNQTDSDPATFTVLPVNDPPVLATIWPMTVASGSPLNFPVTGTDVDNALLALSMVNAPAAATLTSDGAGNGNFSWVTECLDSGVHVVTFIVSDGELADSQDVTITVLPNPDRFVATPDAMAFSFVLGETLPKPDSFRLTDPGCGELRWEAAASQPWVLLVPDTGLTPRRIVVNIDTAGLVAGAHDALITVVERTTLKMEPVQIQVPVHVDVETELCICPCIGDPFPHCDSIYDIRDVVWMIGVAFREYLDLSYGACPTSMSDVSCDCHVDVVDIVTAIDVVFRNAPATYCDPCALKVQCPSIIRKMVK